MVEQWLEPLPRPKGVRRSFLAPNQLLEVGPADAVILQVIPEAPGRCRVRRMDYTPATRARPPRNLSWLQQDIEVAESTQTGLASGAGEADEAGPASPELEEFRRTIATLIRNRPSRAR